VHEVALNATGRQKETTKRQTGDKMVRSDSSKQSCEKESATRDMRNVSS
jgi:hypothetical protein